MSFHAALTAGSPWLLSLCEHQLSTSDVLMLRNAPRGCLAHREHVKKIEHYYVLKLLILTSKNTMSFLLQLRFKTLQCHLYATKKKRSRCQWIRGKAIWVPRKENTMPIQSPGLPTSTSSCSYGCSEISF